MDGGFVENKPASDISDFSLWTVVKVANFLTSSIARLVVVTLPRTKKVVGYIPTLSKCLGVKYVFKYHICFSSIA